MNAKKKQTKTWNLTFPFWKACVYFLCWFVSSLKHTHPSKSHGWETSSRNSSTCVHLHSFLLTVKQLLATIMGFNLKQDLSEISLPYPSSLFYSLCSWVQSWKVHLAWLRERGTWVLFECQKTREAPVRICTVTTQSGNWSHWTSDQALSVQPWKHAPSWNIQCKEGFTKDLHTEQFAWPTPNYSAKRNLFTWRTQIFPPWYIVLNPNST